MTQEALDHLTALGHAQDEFLASIGVVDAALPVPWLGRWRVRDLVQHLARVHHWAAAQARDVHEVPLGRGPFVLDELYARCAGEVFRTLTDLGPDAIGSTLVGKGPASFWRRRQLHETTVHLWDLRTAGGLDVEASPTVWADAVDEVVTVMQPRQERLARMEPLAAAVDLLATDSPGTTWRLGPAGEPAVVVSGRAVDLGLVLWGRLGPDAAGLTIDGDEAALSDVLAQPLTP